MDSDDDLPRWPVKDNLLRLTQRVNKLEEAVRELEKYRGPQSL